MTSRKFIPLGKWAKNHGYCIVALWQHFSELKDGVWRPGSSTLLYWARSPKHTLCMEYVLIQGPVVRRPISANPGLNFNPDFSTPLFKSPLGTIFPLLFWTSNDQIASKKIWIAFRPEMEFHTNHGLSLLSFEQPRPREYFQKGLRITKNMALH